MDRQESDALAGVLLTGPPAFTRQVALLGSAMTTRAMAPFKDEAWEIWVCGADTSGTQTPRFDRWYEIHDPKVLLDPQDSDYQAWHPKHLELMRAAGKKCWTLRESPELADASIIPLARIFNRFKGNFLTSSVAWMICQAMIETFDRCEAEKRPLSLKGLTIGLWGIEMCTPGEYDTQRDGLLHFIFLAEEHGAEVVAPEGCSLIPAPKPYPLAGESDIVRTMRTRMGTYQGQRNAIAARHAQDIRELARLDGAIGELNQIIALSSR